MNPAPRHGGGVAPSGKGASYKKAQPATHRAPHVLAGSPVRCPNTLGLARLEARGLQRKALGFYCAVDLHVKLGTYGDDVFRPPHEHPAHQTDGA